MLIIDRTFLFLTWAISLVIVAVSMLMVLRMVNDGLDLNPFGWIARTTRRLSDPFVVPVRGGLRGFGMDVKFAPLIVILIVILLGFFVLQLVGTIATTIVGVLNSTRSGAMFAALGFVLYGLLSIYLLLITIRIVFSWGGLSYSNRIMRFLVNATEPLLGPLRRMIPPLGWIDISPLVAIVIIWLFQQAIAGTLLRGAALHVF